MILAWASTFNVYLCLIMQTPDRRRFQVCCFIKKMLVTFLSTLYAHYKGIISSRTHFLC